MHHSIWSDYELPKFDTLHTDLKTDVLVIGGGMAGLLCAYRLHASGVDTVLVEQNRICSGVTANTTAKITSQHGLIYAKLLHSLGKERAKLYLQANQDALAQFKRMCKDIPCDFEEKSAFVYSMQDPAVLEREAEALHHLGFPANFRKKIPLPFPVAGAVEFGHQAQFHPLIFAGHIAKALRIYENTAVRTIENGTAVTEHGRIQAEHIIVATHFPFLNTHGSYFLKLYQHRSYVVALENGPYLDGMYIGAEQNSLSFRNTDGLLLLGGGGHRTGKHGGGWLELAVFARRNYPEAREVRRWATQDCMSLDGIPYIGRYSKHTPNLYVATGFNKWGMTGSMVAAAILRDQILGKETPYDPLFSPSRGIFKPQLAINTASAVGNLLRLSPKRCPHMGCALKWNPLEHTWDCPCHGSRFAEDGKKLNNPSTGDLKP